MKASEEYSKTTTRLKPFLKKYKLVDDHVSYHKNGEIEHTIVKSETPKKLIKLKARKALSPQPKSVSKNRGS